MPNKYDSLYTGAHNDGYEPRITALTEQSTTFTAQITTHTNQISALESWQSNIDTWKNALLNTIYPVGAIYISTVSTNPNTLFGGTWEAIQGQFLIGANSTYTAGSTGGSTTHSHKYGIQVGVFYQDTVLEGNTNGGILNYDSSNSISLSNISSYTTATTLVNNNAASSTKSITGVVQSRAIGQNEYVSTLPPYLAVYIWKRTA